MQMRSKTDKRRLPLILACFGIVLVLGANLLEAGNIGFASTDTETRARALEVKLMAPCCFSETIDRHQSQIAREMRAEVRLWLTQGVSEAEILERYIKRHGTRILVTPPQQGFDRLLFWVPLFIIVLLSIGVSLLLRAWYRRAQPAASRANSNTTVSKRNTEL
jgi:cytochrome c-type biogenesis protein CcmH